MPVFSVFVGMDYLGIKKYPTRQDPDLVSLNLSVLLHDYELLG